MTDRLGRKVCGAALLLGLAAAPSAAQTPPELTAAQQASLARALNLWRGGMGLPAAGAGPGLTVVAEGDHYRLTQKLPLGQLPPDVSIAGGDFSADLRPLDGDRWQLSNADVGMPITVRTTLAKQGTSPGGPLNFTFDFQGQSGSATLDPTLATASTSEFAAAGVQGSVQAPQATPKFHSSRVVLHGDWQPAGPGRVDRASSGSISDLSVDVAGPQKVSVAIHTLQIGGTLRGLSPDRFTQLMDRVRAAQDNLPSASSVQKKSDLTPAQRELFRLLLGDMRDVASAVEVQFSAEDVAFSGADHLVRLGKLAFSEGFGAPGGHADAHFRFSAEGLDSPDIPPAIAASYMPHRLVLAPRVSGPSADSLFKLIDDALATPAPSSQDLQKETAALFAKGPLDVALDELSFDIGPTLLSATGAVQVAGTTAQDVTGSAIIRAKHFDALMQRAASDPMLQQAAPVLIFIKGIGQADPDGSVTWKIAYSAGKVLVNGTDLSQMLPHH